MRIHVQLCCLLLFAQYCAAQAGEPQPVKIVTLGDSITRGVRAGVKAEETFAVLLQKELRGRDVKRTWSMSASAANGPIRP